MRMTTTTALIANKQLILFLFFTSVIDELLSKFEFLLLLATDLVIPLFLSKSLRGISTKRKIIFDEDGKIVKKQNRNNNEDDNNNNNDDDDSRLTVIYKWKRDRKR